jgi:hypothetical protein
MLIPIVITGSEYLVESLSRIVIITVGCFVFGYFVGYLIRIFSDKFK